jgi:hypothetical protein
MEFQGLAQGPQRRLRYRASVFVLVMGSAAGFSAPVAASKDSYRMPQEICDILREEPLNQSLIRQIARRPDFLDLLDYADENCGGVAALLIGATGSIPVLASDRDGVLPVLVAGPGTGTGGAPDNGGPTDGGDTGTGGAGSGDTGSGGSGTGGTGTGGTGTGGTGGGGSGAGDSNGHASGDSSSDSNGHDSGDSSSDGSNDDDDHRSSGAHGSGY